MSLWRFSVTYEGTIEAADSLEAKQWAEEEVESGLWQITTSDVERIKPDEQSRSKRYDR